MYMPPEQLGKDQLTLGRMGRGVILPAGSLCNNGNCGDSMVTTGQKGKSFTYRVIQLEGSPIFSLFYLQM